MARGGGRVPSPISKTYGFPIYRASWIPVREIASAAGSAPATDASSGGDIREPAPPAGAGVTTEPQPQRQLVVLAGGGGEGRSGIPNAVVVASFDPASESLSDQPLFRLGTGSELPYRMAVHPRGDGIVCSFPKGCRWFKWELTEGKELDLKPSEKILTELENIGLQLVISFSEDGSMLATGSEEGDLRVFKWPSMELILDESGSGASVKDLDFSSDSKLLASVRSSGPCRVWDLTASKVVANLARNAGENFIFCRFAQVADNNQVLHITAMQNDGGNILQWNTTSWERITSKKITREGISAFTFSPDGKLISIGTIEGNILVLSSDDLAIRQTIKKGHLGIVTSLAFSEDSRALLSSSMDSTARVTLVQTRKSSGLNFWLLLLFVILAFLVYHLRYKTAA